MTTDKTNDPRRVEYRRVADLKPDPRNPKAHASAEVRASISRFGFIEPIAVDGRTNLIISGHGRTEVLVGMEEKGETPPSGVKLDDEGRWTVPVVTGWESRTDSDAAGAIIALNRTTELGGWVDDELLDLLDALGEEEDGFTGVGFGDEEIEEIRERLEHIGEGLESDEAPERMQDTYEVGENSPTLADRYGTPPTTVFNSLRGDWRDRKREWVAQGIDSGDGREAELVYDAAARKYTNWFEVVNKVSKTLGYRPSDKYVVENHQAELNHVRDGTSLFDPVLAELMYLWHTREGATILDPWAGGSVRGIVAALLGRNYVGIDIRPEQIEANKKQWEKRLQAAPRDSQVGSIEWRQGDSAQALAEMEPDSVDMLFGCPPYYDLEKYSDDPDDLSNLSNEEFDERMAITIEHAARALRDDSFAVFVVGSVRDKKSRILDMRRCMVDAAERAGMWLYNDAVLLNHVASVRFTMGKAFRERRLLSRVHQEILVFVKGEAKVAATRAGGDSFDLSKDIDALLESAEEGH